LVQRIAANGREAREERFPALKGSGMPSFDLYEYVAYIIPGSVLVACLIPLCPWIRNQFIEGGQSPTGRPAANIGIFLIVTYLLGHVLHVVPHRIEAGSWSYPLSCEGGVLGQNAVVVAKSSDQHLLSAPEFDELRDRLEKFEFDMTKLELQNPDHFVMWCNALLRMEDAVQTAKRGALLGTFIKGYGLYLGLTTAFALVCLVCAILIFLPSSALSRVIGNEGIWPVARLTGRVRVQLLIFLVVMGIAGSMMLYRLLYFGRLFARELFLSYLAT
jgi:hypothetical protein